MRKTAVPGIVFIVILLLFSLSYSAPLNVMTYNVGNIFVVPKHQQRQKILALELEKRIIDANTKGEYFVFFLQEVFSPDFMKKLQKISSQHHIYMTKANSLNDKAYRHGLVTLTNITRNFTETSSIASESFTPWENDMYENRHQRGILTLCLNLNMDDKPLCLVNLHMAYTLRPVGGLSSMHQQQLKQLQEYIEAIPHQTIVAGDFNLGSIQWLIKEKNEHLILNQVAEFPHHFAGKLWMDPNIENFWHTYVNDLNDLGFQEAKSDLEQVSFSSENGLVKNPGIGVRLMNIASLEIPYYGQIDHIFYKFSPHSALIEYCNNEDMGFTEKYQLLRSRKDVELSDHYAIKASFEISLPSLLLTRQ